VSASLFYRRLENEKSNAQPHRTTVRVVSSNGERVSRRGFGFYFSRESDTSAGHLHTPYAARLGRRQRLNGGPFIVGEFIPHDSSLPLGRLNHDPAACLDSERISPSEAKS
jgi:hypothetical protein